MLARPEMGESCTTLDEVRRSKPTSGWCAADVVFVGRIKATWAVFADQLLEIAETQWSRSWFAADFRGYR